MAAALRIVDRDGADALTMRGLGRELGADPMAAYHHVPNKDAVLDGVVEAVWADVELEVDASLPWQDQLLDAARSIRDGLQRHPNALPIMATRPNLSRPGFAVVDRILGILLGAGVAPRPALELVNAAGEFLIGHALVASSPPLPPGGPELSPTVDAASADVPLPHLTAVLAEVDVGEVGLDAIFEAGLQAFVAGIEARAHDGS